jgi:F-type H+-transporting ATPase subunit b
MANEAKHDAKVEAAAPHGPADPAHTTSSHTGTEAGHGGGHGESSPLSIDWAMFLWFLGVFVIAGLILKKFAWAPILDGLEKRENDLRASIDNAERIKQELAALDEKRRITLAEADAKAKEILDAARKASQEAARVIEHKARDEANILLDNARREVKSATDKARAVLRQESAELATGLSAKILKDQLDPARARALADRLISEM